MRQSHELDPRRRRTREALQSAFILLALRRRYHEIHIEEILEASGVGRSTFYEHFSGKDALLASSMDSALSLLSEVPTGDASAQQVALLFTHFWENRPLARSLFQGAPIRVVRRALVAKIEGQLKRRAGGRLRLPPRLAAHALADGMLSPILAWLSGEASCSPPDLAVALRTSTKATLASMVTASSA